MKIQFDKYDYDQQELLIKAYCADIKLDMVFETITINGNHEVDVLDDSLYGLYVLVQGAHISLAYLWQEAEKQHDAIRAETKAEIDAEKAMHSELSSPQATGRI
jgi:hypothetical protein